MIKLPRQDSIRLSSSSFSKMINLKLFINNNARLSGGIGFLPNEIRFIDWPEFSSEYLPFDSNPKKLLKLNMPRSYMSGLGEGFKVVFIIPIYYVYCQNSFFSVKGQIL